MVFPTICSHRRRVGADGGGNPTLILGGQADVEIQAQRPGDLFTKEHVQRPAGDAPHQFADEKAEGDGVIVLPRAGGPERGLRRDGLRFGSFNVRFAGRNLRLGAHNGGIGDLCLLLQTIHFLAR